MKREELQALMQEYDGVFVDCGLLFMATVHICEITNSSSEWVA